MIPARGMIIIVLIFLCAQAVLADSRDNLEEVHLFVMEDTQSVRQRLLAWAEDWSRGDAEAVIAYYAAQFNGTQVGQSRERWEQQRRQRIKPQRNIRIQLLIRELNMGPDVNRAEVRFEQNYRSNSYSDQVVKKMRWQRIKGEWYIVQESVIE